MNSYPSAWNDTSPWSTYSSRWYSKDIHRVLAIPQLVYNFTVRGTLYDHRAPFEGLISPGDVSSCVGYENNWDPRHWLRSTAQVPARGAVLLLSH